MRVCRCSCSLPRRRPILSTTIYYFNGVLNFHFLEAPNLTETTTPKKRRVATHTLRIIFIRQEVMNNTAENCVVNWVTTISQQLIHYTLSASSVIHQNQRAVWAEKRAGGPKKMGSQSGPSDACLAIQFLSFFEFPRAHHTHSNCFYFPAGPLQTGNNVRRRRRAAPQTRTPRTAASESEAIVGWRSRCWHRSDIFWA